MKVEEKLKNMLALKKEAEMPEPQKAYSLLKNENFHLKHKVKDLELENNVLKMKLSNLIDENKKEDKLNKNFLELMVKLDVS
jgi:hypothetical protein